MNSVMMVAVVAAGGAVGAVGRHVIAEIVRLLTPMPPFMGTMAANLLGCFAIGFAFVRLEEANRPEWLKGLLVTGLLGAFTTFSTFSLDAMHLIHDRRVTALAWYVLGSVAAGLVAVKVGMAIAALRGGA